MSIDYGSGKFLNHHFGVLVRKINLTPVTGSMISFLSEGNRLPICALLTIANTVATTNDIRYEWYLDMLWLLIATETRKYLRAFRAFVALVFFRKIILLDILL